jgi:probable phosphoglycerate mutase
VSPLIRALATCELAGFGDKAELEPTLMEWDYGDYEGMTTSDIRLERPGWNVFVDGCPGGEDAAAVGRRRGATSRSVRAR